ncbi:response regulator transcription factor [Thermophilibacter immobilis]|jgi:DNA-binding response OmpR family regulator|uniref:Response regulator transcription factor n=1 Tax=Thermophilibacter immobilis TaxID=2779519 RepID=A0A7S7RUE9_9ACTN|nr:response regulator transcription factor [Thermophilibacter immobilis]QOY60199.1 response regulator transcription factor [Thermophilibacter immobilis]
MRRLLVIEDDARIRDELCLLLERNGYEALAPTELSDVATQILSIAPDLVLLDLNLPGVDGQYVCRAVRHKSQVPIVVVTSRDNDMDELLALSLGADDFVAKPYNNQVLLAHVASVLKRGYGEQELSSQITHAGVTLDTARCCVSAAGRTAELTKNELRILALLMRSAGSVVSRQRIQEELWATDEFVDDNTLTVNVSHLRQTLSQIGVEGLVRTRRGMGYLVE